MKNMKDELKKMTAAELATQVDVLRRELFSIRLSKATKPVKDTAYTRKLRREIARTLTFLHEKRTEV